ncbi:MAG: YfhO family protein [Proteocatella sp.]
MKKNRKIKEQKKNEENQKVTYNRIDILIVGAYILIPLIFFIKLLVTKNYMVAGDGLGYLAGSQFIKYGIVNGEIPLWNRFNAAGTPFVGDIQNKFFYPFMWIYLIFSAQLGFKLYFLMHLSLAGIFMYFYLRNIGLIRATSFFGGIVFMFSNVIIIRYEHINIMNSIIWMPLMLLLVENLVSNPKNKFAIILGLVMGLQFLGGFPQTALYTDIVVFFYYIFISCQNKITLKNIIKKISVSIIIYIGIISIQLIPLIELMKFSGRNNVSYEFFASYSFDIRLLANMVFPRFWGPWAGYLNKPMEFPTDIYLGVIVFNLIIYTMLFDYKNQKVKLLRRIMIITLLFSCAPQIPFLGHLIYKVPIINSFRVLSRSFFILVISGIILSSIGLNKIIINREYNRYFKYSSILCIIILVFAIISNKMLTNNNFDNVYLPTILLSMANLLVAFIMMRCKFDNKKSDRLTKFIVITMSIICVLDVYYFNIDIESNRYRTGGLFTKAKNINEVEINSDISKYLQQQEIEQYRIILDYDTDGQYYKEAMGLKANNNIFNRLMSMQSYITFENKQYLNINSVNNGKYINTKDSNLDVLSMFSNKYIVKEKDSKLLFAYNVKGKEIYVNEKPLEIELLKNNIGGIPIAINLEKNTNLKVEIEFNIDEIPSEFFTIDLYGSNYDLYEANKELVNQIKVGKNKFEFILNTGDVEIPDDAVLRIVGYNKDSDSKITINKLVVSKIDEKIDDRMKLVYENNDLVVYENLNAKPIIFSPQKVINIETSDASQNIWDNKKMDEISYVNGFKNLDITDTSIEILDIKNNSVSANVKSEKETFVNMSQCYYPGWNVYVDGEKSNLYIVNNVIQGVAIPTGEHEIVFKYQPKSLYLGAFISLITLIISIFVLFKNKTKNII